MPFVPITFTKNHFEIVKINSNTIIPIASTHGFPVGKIVVWNNSSSQKIKILDLHYEGIKIITKKWETVKQEKLHAAFASPPPLYELSNVSSKV